MAAPPTLVGMRVRLRTPRIDDADTIFAEMASDPEVTRYLRWAPHSDVGETRRVIDEIYLGSDSTVWLIEWRATGAFVGVCELRRPVPHSIELGYCLSRRWWEKGIMTEVVTMMIDFARQDPAAYRVWATCNVGNAASARVLEKAGMTLEGRLARYAVLPNLAPEPQDCLMFATAVR